MSERQPEAQAAYIQKKGIPERTVPADLDPRTFEYQVTGAINGELGSSPALDVARSSFSGLFTALQSAQDKERAIYSDTTMTEDARTLAVAEALANNGSPLRNVAKATDYVREERKRAEGKVNEKLAAMMSRQDAVELREVARQMSREEREQMVKDLEENQDWASLSALVSHPSPYAAGLERGERERIRRMVERNIAPDESLNRDQLAKAEEQLKRGEELYLENSSQMMPDQRKVEALRERQSASRKARGAE